MSSWTQVGGPSGRTLLDPFIAGRETVGLDWVGFHDLRYFRATQWLMNGVDVNSVKELLGYSSIETTMRYVHYVETFAMKTVAAAQRKEESAWLSSETETGYIGEAGMRRGMAGFA